MSLSFISIGLSSERDMSVKAIDTAKSCDRLFAEFYTSKLDTDRERLGKFLGREITVLSRHDLEDGCQDILDLAKSGNIGLLVGGDAFVSTAHGPLMSEARKQGIEVKVVHGSSIIPAVCESGLHLQKFGQAITIPFPDRTKDELPVSVYEVISENQKRGLHTLCLLDMVAEEGRFMKVSEALNILLDLESAVKKKAVDRDDGAVVFSRLGSDSQKIIYGKMGEMFGRDAGEPPYTLVLLGKLHFSEKENLIIYSRATRACLTIPHKSSILM